MLGSGGSFDLAFHFVTPCNFWLHREKENEKNYTSREQIKHKLLTQTQWNGKPKMTIFLRVFSFCSRLYYQGNFKIQVVKNEAKKL